MRLDRDSTSITITEQLLEVEHFTEVHAEQISRYWIADLSATSIDGQFVEMSRNGETPDGALRNLEHAMREADLSL